nr:phage tail length tape measure family protein [Planctomonas sp. JC2975]
MGESGGLAGIGSKLGETLLAGLGAVGIAVGVGEFIKKGVEEYSAADALNAQFAAGIQSTNNAAGLTVKGMDELAASISGYSGQAYDSIGKTEQVLQTFTNIRNVGPDKIFDDATTAAANMAAKLGGDASSSAIQLGKALNDPVKGITSLTRVGVTFTQSQKDQISAMVAAGDTMGAQKVILNELSTEFGGAAKAAGETLPGEINRSKVAFGELTKAIVSGVMPAVTPLVGGIADVMNKITPVIEGFSEHVRSAFEYLHGYISGEGSDADVGAWEKPLETIGNIAIAVGAGFKSTFEAFKPVISAVGSAFAQLAPTFAPLLPQVLQLASAFSPLSLIFHALLPVLPSLITLVTGLATQLGGDLAGVFKVLLPVITSVVTMLTGDLAGVFKMLVPIITEIVNILGKTLGSAFKELMPAITMLVQFFGKLVQVSMPIVKVIWDLIGALLPLLEPLLQLIGPILTPLISLFTELLQPILQLVSTLLTALMPIITVLIQALAEILPPVIKALMPLIQAGAEAFSGILGPAIKMVTDILNGIIVFLTGVFTGNWQKAWQGIVDIFSGIWNGIVGIVKGIINGIIDAINGVIKGVNSIGGAVGIHVGTIPHLAQGATILPTPGGTVVRVAEGGKPESVVDTGKLNALLDRALNGPSGKGDTFEIYEAVSAEATAKQVMRIKNAKAAI